MRLDWKIIIGGGLVMYITQFIVSFGSGAVIHEGFLDPLYRATEAFWRPELRQDPPDMAALMPRWITTGLLAAFLLAGIYDNIRSALNGSGLIKGLKFGLILAIIYATINAGFSGIFDLPNAIWGWWTLEGFIIHALGGMVLAGSQANSEATDPVNSLRWGHTPSQRWARFSRRSR